MFAKGQSWNVYSACQINEQFSILQFQMKIVLNNKILKYIYLCYIYFCTNLLYSVQKDFIMTMYKSPILSTGDFIMMYKSPILSTEGLHHDVCLLYSVQEDFNMTMYKSPVLSRGGFHYDDVQKKKLYLHQQPKEKILHKYLKF